MRITAAGWFAAALAMAVSTGPVHAIAFARVDRNENGVISPEEVSRYMNGMNPVQIRKCDRNRDGLIEPDEFPCLASIYDLFYRDTKR